MTRGRWQQPEDHQDPYTPDEDDPDYRFSEAAGYAGWEPPQRAWLRPLIWVVTLLVLGGMLLPLLPGALRMLDALLR